MDREAVDLEALARYVRDELEGYVYKVPPGTLGGPLPPEEVARLLSEMWRSLVEPEWRVIAMRDTFAQVESEWPELRACVLLADDGDGFELYFDPTDEEFFLAMGGESIGVRGDAVGCFMAR
jgi:hypothetical protein